jgi:hypothetical protein
VTSGIREELPAIYEEVTQENDYLLGHYSALNPDALATLSGPTRDQAEQIIERETQGALAKMTMFPAFMLLCYLGLIAYFKSRGGYKPKVLASQTGAAGHP